VRGHTWSDAVDRIAEIDRDLVALRTADHDVAARGVGTVGADRVVWGRGAAKDLTVSR